MRSGHSAASPTLREAVKRRSLVSNPMKGARTLLITPLLVATPCSVASAQTATAVFHQQEYANPQPDQPIFAQTWPGLIAANNEAHAKGFLHNKPAPGTNSSLVLNNAVLTIPGGKIVASINSGVYSVYSGCHLGKSLSGYRCPRVLLSCASHGLRQRASSYHRRGLPLSRWRRHAEQRGPHGVRREDEGPALLRNNRRKTRSPQQHRRAL